MPITLNYQEMRQADHHRFLAELILIALCCVAIGCLNQASPTGSASGTKFGTGSKSSESIPLKAVIDLGVIIQGESTETNRWIVNQSDKPILIAKIERSCECLEVRFPKPDIAPGQKALAQLVYDGAKEPDFKGSLQIEVTLSDETGNKIGVIQVPVEVVPKSVIEP